MTAIKNETIEERMAGRTEGGKGEREGEGKREGRTKKGRKE